MQNCCALCLALFTFSVSLPAGSPKLDHINPVLFELEPNARYASTSVEGTTWLTLDECRRSEVKVTAGKVSVRDLVRKKTRTIRAGKTYVAAAGHRH